MFHEQVNKNLPRYFGNLWTIFILILESPFELIGGTMDRTSPSSDNGSPFTWSISVLSGPLFGLVSVFNVNPMYNSFFTITLVLRVVQTQAILCLNSMSERAGSDKGSDLEEIKKFIIQVLRRCMSGCV